MKKCRIYTARWALLTLLTAACGADVAPTKTAGASSALECADCDLLAAVATASSSYYPEYNGPGNVLDGDGNSIWMGLQGDAQRPWVLTLDLGRARVARLEVDWYYSYGAAEFDVELSRDDGETYVPIARSLVSPVATTPPYRATSSVELGFKWATQVRVVIRRELNSFPAISEVRITGRAKTPPCIPADTKVLTIGNPPPFDRHCDDVDCGAGYQAVACEDICTHVDCMETGETWYAKLTCERTIADFQAMVLGNPPPSAVHCDSPLVTCPAGYDLESCSDSCAGNPQCEASGETWYAELLCVNPSFILCE